MISIGLLALQKSEVFHLLVVNSCATDLKAAWAIIKSVNCQTDVPNDYGYAMSTLKSNIIESKPVNNYLLVEYINAFI